MHGVFIAIELSGILLVNTDTDEVISDYDIDIVRFAETCNLERFLEENGG